MKVLYRLKLCLLGATVALSSIPAPAAGFESIGRVTKINLGQNMITVDETEEEKTYYLPNSTTLDGSPAIFQIQPGNLISFSGESSGSNPTVTSVYVFSTENQGSQP